MKRRIFQIAVVTLLLLFPVPVTLAQASPSPVNPHASPEARALLTLLDSISGQYTITGQHNYPNHVSRWSDRIYDLTGKYPGLFGQDFGFSGDDDKDSVEGRPAMIEEAERQYRNGAVITLTWHAVKPTEDEPVTFRESVQGHLTDFEWSELLMPGSDLYNRWCAQVDVIAGYLKQLREAHVPVLFRPYHEMNGNWFWWGGRPGKNGTQALYRQLFDRFVNYHKLDNLVWVWNVNAPSENAGPFVDYFPGSEYADVITIDNYGEFQQSYYDGALTLAAGKPVALAEVGALPTLEVMKMQPKWTYFMMWSGFAEFANSPDTLQAVFDAPNMLNRDNPHLAEPMVNMRKASAKPSPEPVTPHATSEAGSLLARLYAVSGKNVLSGQENSAQLVTAATEHVFQVTSKYPAIYGADLGVMKTEALDPGAARQALIDEAKRESQAHSIISLSWRAMRPTDEDSSATTQSIQTPLTDFEWNQLLTAGTRLNQRWCTQVDAVATSLKKLQDAGIPVLWRPYPEANGKKFWWAGRKGNRGSAALYRQLFDRLVNHDGVRNLIWVWDAAAPGFGPEAAGQYGDFFPGLMYTDALALNVLDLNSRFPADTFLAQIGVGKVIGVELSAKIPDPVLFRQQTNWTWFLVFADAANAAPSASDPSAEALRKLYDHPRVISRPTSSH